MTKDEPYRDLERGPAPALVDGSVLIVAHDAKLPRVCLKCGAKKDLTRRAEGFEWAPPGLALALLLSPVTFYILSALTRRRGAVTLSLCAPCDARWLDAKTVQNMTFPVALLFTVAVAAAVFNGAYVVGAAVTVAAAAAILWVRARFVRGRTLDVRWIGPRGIELRGVHAAAAQAAVEPAVRR